MPKKKIVITGAEGFIATNLILKLSKNNDFDLIGIDSSIANSHNKIFTNNLINHNRVDIADESILFDLINKADLIVHLAARGNVVESIINPLENFNANAYSTLILLETMRKAGIQNIVFS